MKTTRYNTISRLASKSAAIIAAVLMGLNLASCSSAEDEPAASPYGEDAKVTEAEITFTYTVPEEMFKYAEITVAYNNNAGTDAKWEPMLDNTFKLTYNLKKFPVTAPIVFIYDRTNRSANGVNVDWQLKMDVEVTMTVDGQKVTKTNSESFPINGDLGAAIAALQKNVVDRTYAVKLAKNGDVRFIH